MDVKVILICAVLVLLAVQDLVFAEFLYNRKLPKQDELEGLNLKCIPGRTVLKVQEKSALSEIEESDSDDEDGRRNHMRFSTDDESCQVCVCSVEGKDEYCSRRPAMNVNECMRMANLMDQFKKNEPFDHEKILSYMIRRDLIWHNDEIPYDSKAKCRRGHSYYSNSIRANDTDIDLASDIESLIDYANKSVCFYCICTVSGDAAGCIARNIWTCEYYRQLRDPDAVRDKYRIMFQQDRPGYFRQLSYRLRRTMDDGVFDLIDSVGDGTVDQKCVPYVSTYTDCNEENRCEGCNKCSCSGDGTWECEEVRECSKDELDDVAEAELKRALDLLVFDIENQEVYAAATSKTPNVPQPLEEEKLLGQYGSTNLNGQDESGETNRDGDILAYILRRKKRSVQEHKSSEENDNGTVTFFHTIDAMNEDTLKNSNSSGTLKASKIELIPQASRRSTLLNNSTSKSLQIEYAPPINNQHAADNKVDTLAIHDDKEDLLIHHKMYEITGNQTQAVRDKELSKLVVNELKGGAETIGDKNSPVISNITFTSENDTLTAMTFIAGNLLNKLWNMEKDASDNSLETEKLKHEKIYNLLELFKEPLNLRQETFLRNALGELSAAMEKKDVSNLSLCKNIEVLKKTSGFSEPSEVISQNENNESIETNFRAKGELNNENSQKKGSLLKDSIENNVNEKNATVKALNKINNVLDLIKKYEQVQNSLSDFKSNSKGKTVYDIKKSSKKEITNDEKSTLSVFGNILQTLTTLLIPNKKSKKLIKGIKNQNLFIDDKSLTDKLKDVNLADMSLTAKDKIVLDYLTHVQSSPSCLFNKPRGKMSLPNIEGDILLNLSEFFKIKSMSDLLKLLDSDNNKEKEESELLMRSITSTSKTDIERLEDQLLYTTTETYLHATEKQNVTKFEVTKAKLKLHLKTILEDILELQNINGKAATGKNIEISEVLPCIYNLLNVNKDTSDLINTRRQFRKTKLSKQDKVIKVTEIFDKLNKELKRTPFTRRTNSGNGPRPKSALVLERTIKNLSVKKQQQTRRILSNEPPKPIEDIIKMIDNIDSSGSNTYKSIAYLAEVPSAEKLLLLRTLAVDTKKYMNALKDIQTSIETTTELPIDQHKTIAEFIDNVNLNVNLNSKIINRIDEPRQDIYLSNQERKPAKRFKVYKAAKEIETLKNNENVIKLSRTQVINQLIKNRMQYYLRLKEATGENKNSFTMDLARKIILYLEIGNDNLARQLYKIFVSKNQNKSTNNSGVQVLVPDKYETRNQQMISRRYANKVPLIDFADPTVVNKRKTLSNPDQLIKQLVNIKNMKI